MNKKVLLIMAIKTQIPLRRALGLPLLLLYGLGVTIGGGIYVLVGATAQHAGIHAPVAFLFAALVMAPTAATFAELAGRFPVSAGEAAYVRAGFNSKPLSMVTGLLVAAAGVIASAAISVGSAGYFRQFIDLPDIIFVPAVIVFIGAVAAWGILESVLLASIFTLIELFGLLIIIFTGLFFGGDIVSRLPEVVPASFDPEIWAGIFSAGLLAFFAFIGFGDLVNVAEETHAPEKTLPRAIFLTLAVTTVLYVLVASIAVLAVPSQELAQAGAPLGIVYTKVAGMPSHVISAIAIIAILNTVIIQIIMASRVCYGMATQGILPSVLAKVHPRTQTPVVATVLIIAISLLLALTFPLQYLAEATSRIILIVSCLVNVALVCLKWKRIPAPHGAFIVPVWVPVLGFVVSSLALFF